MRKRSDVELHKTTTTYRIGILITKHYGEQGYLYPCSYS